MVLPRSWYILPIWCMGVCKQRSSSCYMLMLGTHSACPLEHLPPHALLLSSFREITLHRGQAHLGKSALLPADFCTRHPLPHGLLLVRCSDMSAR